jgi:hypothetical protein
MFRVCIAGCRRLPVSIQGLTYLFLLRGLLQVLLGFHVHLPFGINPGTPVSTTELNLCRVLIPSRISFIASSGRVEISKFLDAAVGFVDSLGDGVTFPFESLGSCTSPGWKALRRPLSRSGNVPQCRAREILPALSGPSDRPQFPQSLEIQSAIDSAPPETE